MSKKHTRKNLTSDRRQPAVDLSARLQDPQHFDGRRSQDWIRLAIVVGVAFALRLAFFYLNLRNNPAFHFPIMDSLYHHNWANDIAGGKLWGAEIFFRGPLYPYFLAFLYKIGGSSIAFAVLCQHIIGSLSCGLVYVLSREYFAERVALLAGLLAALYWTFVFFEGELLIVTVAIFLYLTCLLLLSISIRRPDVRFLIAGGIALGLSAIARPNVLAFVPAIPVVYYLTRGTNGRAAKPTVSGWKTRSAIFLASSLIVIMPVMTRNYVVGGAFVPIASSGGVNFYIGNNPTSDGRTAIVPGTAAPWWGGNNEAIAIAERRLGRKLNPAEVSNYYFRLGLDFVASQPDRAASLMLKKLQMFWSMEERSNDKFIYFFWHLAGMNKLPLPGFWLIAPLAIFGGIVPWRRRKKLSVLYLFVLTYMLGVIAFFVNARFRLPVVPILIIFAAFAVWYLITVGRKNWKQLLKLSPILVVAILIVNYEYFTFRKSRQQHVTISHYTVANAYLQMDRIDEAIFHYRLARENYAKDPTPSYELIWRDVNLKLGTLYWQRDECGKAIGVLSDVRGDYPKAIVVRGFLADCYFKTNQQARAYQLYTDILRVQPGNVQAVTGIAQIHHAKGETETAETILASITTPQTPVYVPAYQLLADIQRTTGKLDAAINSYMVILRQPGNEKEALLALSEVYVAKGQPAKAVETLERARPYFPPGDPTVDRRLSAIQNPR